MKLDADEIDTIRKVVSGEMDIINLDENLFEKLCKFYEQDMPYGTQKARDGDPLEWILHRLEADYG